MFNAAAFAVNVCEKMHGCYGCQHTPCLQRNILDYFNGEDNSDISNKMGQSRLMPIFAVLTSIIILYNTWVSKF
jgi:hypothetical protein